MAKRMEEWDAGDFYVALREAADKATDETFRRELGALAEAIEPFQREFPRETAGCGKDLAGVMEDLQWIGAKMGYCTKPRGFEAECEELHRKLCQTIAKVNDVRETCFT